MSKGEGEGGKRRTQPKNANAERGGTQPKSAVPIMHWCLHVISLLMCCQKEELEAAPAYILMLQAIMGNYPPPPPPKRMHFVLLQKKELGLCTVSNRDSNCLLVLFCIKYVLLHVRNLSPPNRKCFFGFFFILAFYSLIIHSTTNYSMFLCGL